MQATINLNSLSSPIGVNLFLSLIFIIFYMVNKSTRGEIVKILCGEIVIISLAYFMTDAAFLLQTISVVFYLQMVLMLFFQELDIVPSEWKITDIGLIIVSFTSVFVFNLPLIFIGFGLLFASLFSLGFWFRYSKMGNDKEREEFADIRLYILLIATGIYLGFDNFLYVSLLNIIIFLLAFIFCYYANNYDNTKIRPKLTFAFSIFCWFGLIHLYQIEVLNAFLK